jgi:hypothetical protein
VAGTPLRVESVVGPAAGGRGQKRGRSLALGTRSKVHAIASFDWNCPPTKVPVEKVRSRRSRSHSSSSSSSSLGSRWRPSLWPRPSGVGRPPWCRRCPPSGARSFTVARKRIEKIVGYFESDRENNIHAYNMRPVRRNVQPKRNGRGRRPIVHAVSFIADHSSRPFQAAAKGGGQRL